LAARGAVGHEAGGQVPVRRECDQTLGRGHRWWVLTVGVAGLEGLAPVGSRAVRVLGQALVAL